MITRVNCLFYSTKHGKCAHLDMHVFGFSRDCILTYGFASGCKIQVERPKPPPPPEPPRKMIITEDIFMSKESK